MSGRKHKPRKTRQQAQKENIITTVLKSICWLCAFCMIVSLIKIATVFAIKGEDVSYVSDMSLTYVRIGIVIHAILSLLAILSRNHLVMIATIILTIALFVATCTLPIYAEATECVSTPDRPCQYALVYHETNIYDF